MVFWGGMKGRTSWQQQNLRQSHWHSAEIPWETSTKLQWLFSTVHPLQRHSQNKNASVSVMLTLLHLQLTLKTFTVSWTCTWGLSQFLGFRGACRITYQLHFSAFLFLRNNWALQLELFRAKIPTIHLAVAAFVEVWRGGTSDWSDQSFEAKWW